jgi:hypothetical protein
MACYRDSFTLSYEQRFYVQDNKNSNGNLATVPLLSVLDSCTCVRRDTEQILKSAIVEAIYRFTLGSFGFQNGCPETSPISETLAISLH